MLVADTKGGGSPWEVISGKMELLGHPVQNDFFGFNQKNLLTNPSRNNF